MNSLPRLLGLLVTVLSAVFVHAVDQRPNILFIMSDDHAAQAISAYGSRVNHQLKAELYRLKKEDNDIDQYAEQQPPPGVD
ncbi:MAG TPA: hypothetical protein VL361_07540 [Candidatus Limnocylindrales bacterium]|nr:hypothetical protein [Candidatus Limnocylindrales bacterium]